MFGSISGHRFTSVVALALLGLAWIVPAAQAADTSFHASGTFQVVSRQGNHVVIAGQGQASPGGLFDAVVESQANNGNYDERGVMTLDFGKGDTLTIYFEDEWIADIRQRVGAYVVTDGTGKLARAGGSGTLTGIPAGDGTGVFCLDGTLSW